MCIDFRTTFNKINAFRDFRLDFIDTLTIRPTMAPAHRGGPDMEIARRDHQTLTRIATTLIALATLAERAGSRSFPVRWLVLSILWPAEAVARAFVIETAQATWPWFEEPLEFQSRPADAMYLAWRFRVLAALLGALLRLACRFDCPCIDRAVRIARPQRLPKTQGGWRRIPCDTS